MSAREEVAAKDELLTSLETRASAAEAELASLRTEAEQMREEVGAKEGLVSKVASLENRAAAMEADLRAERGATAQAREEIAAKQEVIARLETVTSAAEAAKAQMEECLRQRDLAEEQLRQEFKELEQELRRAPNPELEERLIAREDELKAMDAELETMRRQQRELLTTIQQGEFGDAELCRLRRREQELEEQVQQLLEKNTQLGAHANHKQKISHLKCLKAESNGLQEQLQVARRRIIQLEVQLRNGFTFEPLAPTVPSEAPAAGARQIARVPKRRAPARGQEDREEERQQAARQQDRQKAARQESCQSRAAERAVVALEHIRSVVRQIPAETLEHTAALVQLQQLCGSVAPPPADASFAPPPRLTEAGVPANAGQAEMETGSAAAVGDAELEAMEDIFETYKDSCISAGAQSSRLEEVQAAGPAED
jgi:hypothetical protein